jgi:hypothetical protein
MLKYSQYASISPHPTVDILAADYFGYCWLAISDGLVGS